MDVQGDNAHHEASAPVMAAQRFILGAFNQAGAPSIADLGFDAQPELSHDYDKRHSSNKDLIGFPGERVPHISFGFEGERWRIRNIAWVMSQSPTGERLLDILYRAGYRIGFDPMTSTSDHYCNYINSADKVIVLDSRASPHYLVTALALQMGIASAAVDGVYFDSTMTPPAALIAHRLAMAYAHALQLQVAFELRTAKTLTAKLDRDAYWRIMVQRQPRLSSVYAQAAINEMAVSQGIAGAHAVREFFEHQQLRAHYDAEVVNFYRSLPLTVVKDPRLVSGGFDIEAQSFKLKFPFIARAVILDPKLDLLDAANVGTTATIIAAIAELHQIRKNAGVKDRDSWHIKEA